MGIVKVNFISFEDVVKRDTVQNLVLALDEQGLASAICPVYDNGYEDPLIRKQVILAKVYKKC